MSSLLRHRPSILTFAVSTLCAVLFVGVALAWSTKDPGPSIGRLLAEATAGVARYRDPAAAIADGYHPVTSTSGLISEWANPRYEKAGRVFDARHPERLIYVNGPGGPVLAGVVYATPWHRDAPAVLHVWVVHNPAGPFAENLSPRVIVRMLDGA